MHFSQGLWINIVLGAMTLVVEWEGAPGIYSIEPKPQLALQLIRAEHVMSVGYRGLRAPPPDIAAAGSELA